MLKLNKDSIVYIACPANVATGGPELLHQLGLELHKLGVNIYMYYIGHENLEMGKVVHENYQRYGLSYVLTFEDHSNNFLILPEAALDMVGQSNYINYIIWWLSVDYVYVRFDLINQIYNRNSLLSRIVCKIIKLISMLPFFKQLYQNYSKSLVIRLINLTKRSTRYTHWAQSHYAMNFLHGIGVHNVEYISDYLRADFVEQAQYVNLKNKQDIVVYNPKKGMEFTQKIIKAAKGSIKFVPIENMTIQEVITLLASAKLYIDFGNHPGKDRIPREAAILGCCVITGLNGSAKFNKDLSIPDDYKFANKHRNLVPIIAKIQDTLINYNDCWYDFNYYREQIKGEQSEFLQAIHRLIEYKII